MKFITSEYIETYPFSNLDYELEAAPDESKALHIGKCGEVSKESGINFPIPLADLQTLIYEATKSGATHIEFYPNLNERGYSASTLKIREALDHEIEDYLLSIP